MANHNSVKQIPLHLPISNANKLYYIMAMVIAFYIMLTLFNKSFLNKPKAHYININESSFKADFKQVNILLDRYSNKKEFTYYSSKPKYNQPLNVVLV